MQVRDLIKTTRELHQSYQAKAEKHPVELIGQEAANPFNRLLDESKRSFPKNQFINKMQPVTPTQTQLAGLMAKLVVLEESLKAEMS